MVRKAYVGRNLERIGTWLWNKYLWKIEWGLLPKEYNPKVHGPYLPGRFYGKRDTPFGEVQIKDLSAWFGRRSKTPFAMGQSIGRAYHSWVYKYLGARNQSAAIYWQFAFMLAFICWLPTWNRYYRTTGIGAVIDSYLKSGVELSDEAIHLLFSANRWEAVPKMKKLLNSGKSLVIDRYAYSGVAFTAAKGLDLKWCKQPDAGLPEPDAVFYLDLPSSDAVARGGYGNERYENQSFQEKVRGTFFRLEDSKWTIVDARQSIDDVERQLRSLTEKVLAEIPSAPIGRLWSEGAEFGSDVTSENGISANERAENGHRISQKREGGGANGHVINGMENKE